MAYLNRARGRVRTPVFKLFLAGLVALCLIIPLLMIYLLVYDRQDQSQIAQDSIAAGWGGPQTIVGPVIVIPYTEENIEQVNNDGKVTSRTVKVTKNLYLSADKNDLKTVINPKRKSRSIYESVLYDAENSGSATFKLPDDFGRYGIDIEDLKLDNIELRFGISDARGLQSNSSVKVNGKSYKLNPGKGLNASKNSGFFSFIDWDAKSPLKVDYIYSIRGNKSLQLIPRGAETSWDVESTWPHPSFTGSFLPTTSNITDKGFSSSHDISNLALGQSILLKNDPPPAVDHGKYNEFSRADSNTNNSQSAVISMVEPVNLYSQVDRATKYGFMFIGFTFLAFLMFDVVGGARVSSAEYLLTGAGLVLFFVMLLAFAEVVGFALAYLIAGGAITGLLTSYSAAVLKSWKRAQVIGGLLIGLYAALYTLLNLEGYSLLIGSVMLFIALAILMWTTRAVNWSSSSEDEAIEEEEAEERPIATVT